MIPGNLNDSPLVNTEVKTMTDATFKVVDGEKVADRVDTLEAVIQSLAFMLSVERYKYPIYSWDYGVELEDLIGKDIAYICPEIIRRVTDALKSDDRVTSVTSFSFEQEGTVLNVTFKVKTVYGDSDFSMEVNI